MITHRFSLRNRHYRYRLQHGALPPKSPFRIGDAFESPSESALTDLESSPSWDQPSRLFDGRRGEAAREGDAYALRHRS